MGRNVGFRSLYTNRMKFLKLPNEVHSILGLALSHSKDKLAVAVRLWEPEEYDMANISVLFYAIERRQFKKLKDDTIRVTRAIKSREPIYPCYVKT